MHQRKKACRRLQVFFMFITASIKKYLPRSPDRFFVHLVFNTQKEVIIQHLFPDSYTYSFKHTTLSLIHTFEMHTDLMHETNSGRRIPKSL
jgi:hypothetical protein